MLNQPNLSQPSLKRQKEQSERTSYFRGRKLHGKTVKLPDGYRGIVAVTSGPEETEVVDPEAETAQGSLQTQAEFDELIVWGHEATVDSFADPYSKGVEEWIALAEKIHAYSAPAAPKEK
ncbi:hypothetical protein N0V88_004978 [Collariella sp. IMI 366227]|nr:hypothetical protein N0V88_004978 [Collariella sp. IMI 366227]